MSEIDLDVLCIGGIRENHNSDLISFNEKKSIESLLDTAIRYHRDKLYILAEEKYLEVLKRSPSHPDANHNLGVMALHFQKYELALSYVRRSIESNPLNPQYWNTFIWILISSNRINDARLQLKECILKGLDKKIFESAIERLNSPTHEELNTLIQCFNDSDLDKAENIANNLINNYPDYPFAYKALCAVYAKKALYDKAVIVGARCIEMLPKDVEALSNYGFSLYKNGDFKNAELIIKNALQIDSTHVNSLSNLSSLMLDQARYEEGKKYALLALEQNPTLFEVYKYLGNIYFFSKDIKSAISCYEKSIELNSSYWSPHNNLGAIYHKQGKIEKSIDHYGIANNLCPSSDKSAVLFQLAYNFHILGDIDTSIKILTETLELKYDIWVLDSVTYLCIIYYLSNEYNIVNSLYNLSKKIKIAKNVKEHSLPKYLDYIISLIQSKENTNEERELLYVIGDSHSLALNNINVSMNNKEYKCTTNWILGVKAYHLGSLDYNHYKFQFEKIIPKIPNNSKILFTIGEIDCRFNEGIMEVWRQNKNISIQEIVKKTICDYLNYIDNITKSYNYEIIICGVPAVNIPIDILPKDEADVFLYLLDFYNKMLKIESQKLRYLFLDTFFITNAGSGISNKMYHLDNIHLYHSAYQKAFNCL